jgi:NADP-dependent 3-hydroxy acid dehydrogenase YdfG
VAEFTRSPTSPLGHVIIVASGAGVHSAYGVSTYDATKTGSDGLCTRMRRGSASVTSR